MSSTFTEPLPRSSDWQWFDLQLARSWMAFPRASAAAQSERRPPITSEPYVMTAELRDHNHPNRPEVPSAVWWSGPVVGRDPSGSFLEWTPNASAGPLPAYP